jgi:hypothetical protein
MAPPGLSPVFTQVLAHKRWPIPEADLRTAAEKDRNHFAKLRLSS